MSVGKLTGPKKAAILLLALGEDGAAEVMKNLEESEIQQVGYYMTRFTDVAPEELDIVLEEFYRNSVMQEEGVNINASPDFVKNALSKALGAEKAKELEGSLHSGQEEGGLDSIRYADPVMISNYLRSEHPQTIALVLSYIRNTDQSSIVLRNLPENLQADVLYRMAVIDSIPPGVVSEMNDVLFEEMKSASSMVTKVGGVTPVAEILGIHSAILTSAILNSTIPI